VNADMFRQEAVAHHVHGTEDGDILRYDHTWTRIAYVLLVVACLAAFAFLSLFSVNEWATGKCVVRIDGRRILTATAPATVESIEEKPGAYVEADAVLVQMHNVDEGNELARATKEFELQLVRILRDPNDLEAKANLTALRARRDQAKNEYDARTIKAPIAGFVTDIRARIGQRVNPGEVIASLTPKEATQASVLAMIPADYRPMLEVGQTMRFELDGFRYEYADLKVEEVSAEGIGPAEVARFLGEEKAGTVPSTSEPGAKVLVSAKLAKSTFTSEGEPFEYFDGLTGNAEIRVRRETLLVTLVPALRAFMP
jgi:membrane fusion protein (multidrug efflux system)